MNAKTLLPLRGALQHYEWGGYDFIPRLIGKKPKAGQAVAELWMGNHHRGPSMVRTADGWEPLGRYLARRPEILGAEVRRKFGDQLPFLFKVLDVREMLSIQSHPTKVQAQAGYARENAAGIPLDAPHRNFKDDNHKPEVMVALTDFWLLHGFRPAEEIAQLLRAIPELKPLQPHFVKQDLQALYKHVMELPQTEVDHILTPLRDRLAAQPPADKSHPDFWAARAFRPMEERMDRGIFSIYLLNLQAVPPGRGIFQAAGVPHAYLEGVNVELMANSDNVFRAGLTPKHVDVPELLRHLKFETVRPQLLKGQSVGAFEYAYLTPAEDFQLNCLQLPGGAVYEKQPSSLELLLVADGSLQAGEEVCGRGSILLAAAQQKYRLQALEDSRVFKALVPTQTY